VRKVRNKIGTRKDNAALIVNILIIIIVVWFLVVEVFDLM
jgi:hypothetical protein